MSLREWLSWLKGFLRERYVWVVLLVLFVFLGPEYGAPFFSIAAFILAIIDAKKSGRKIFNIGPSGKFIWIYVAFVAVSIIYSINKEASLLTLLMWVAMSTSYFALTSVIDTDDKFRNMMHLIGLAMGLMGGIACLQYILVSRYGVTWDFLVFWTPLDKIIPQIIPFVSYTGELRASSTFSNPNIFAEVMLVLVPLCFYAIAKAQHKGTRNLFIICVFVGVLGTAFSFCRVSYLCYFVLLFLALLFLLPRLDRNEAFLLVSIVIIGLVVLLMTPNVFLERISSIGSGDNSTNNRFIEWGHVLNFIKERPILGYGAGTNTTKMLLESVGITDGSSYHAHSLYLELLVEGGIVGLVSFFVPVVMVVKNQFHVMLKEKKNRILGFCVLSALLMILLYGLTDYPLLSPKLVALFFIIFAISDTSLVLWDVED